MVMTLRNHIFVTELQQVRCETQPRPHSRVPSLPPGGVHGGPCGSAPWGNPPWGNPPCGLQPGPRGPWEASGGRVIWGQRFSLPPSPSASPPFSG